MGRFRKFLSNISKKKRLSPEEISATKLSRCLSTVDLTALGIGTTLGAGVYVVVGEVARVCAGPGVMLSFFIAAVSAFFSGLCYAEFGARVPKTGSAYVYGFVAVGELMAFVTGWNLILNYLIATSSMAKAWSSNFDGIVDGRISKFFSEHLAMNVTGLAEYADPFSFGIAVAVTILIGIGVQESAIVTNIFVVINLGVILYVTITGLFRVNIANWRVDPSEVPEDDPNKRFVGQGGFLPNGFSGVMAGAGTCFFSFVGFDTIACTGEEVKNPRRSIPIAILVCLTVCFLAYAAISAVLTLMVPYYTIPSIAPLPFAFAKVGWDIARYIIAVGAVCALTTSLVGAMFPLPRTIYAMATDGLMFRFLDRVNKRLKTPLVATLISGFLAAIMAALFSLKNLVDMSSIGTLFAYALVALSVPILRGQRHSVGLPSTETANSDEKGELPLVHRNSGSSVETAELSPVPHQPRDLDGSQRPASFREYIKLCFIPEKGRKEPTPKSEWISEINTYLLLLSIILINFGLVYFDSEHSADDRTGFITACVVTAVFGSLILLLCVSLSCQPENQDKVYFKVPAVPWIPTFSMLVNLHLMFKMSVQTWIFYAIWMAVGFLIYFGYGYRHSVERSRTSEIHPLRQDTEEDHEQANTASRL